MNFDHDDADAAADDDDDNDDDNGADGEGVLENDVQLFMNKYLMVFSCNYNFCDF